MSDSATGTDAGRRYAQIGGYLLDTRTRALWRAGQPLRLTPKAADLLAILARVAPETVTKDELMRQLWPEAFVCEANIPNLVAEIRGTLEDNVRPARYVRTAHRVGYALCCAVEWREDPTDEALDQPAANCYVVVDDRERELVFGDNLIGRGHGCRVFVPSSTVSRQHACITVGPDGPEIRDLGSRNGTFLNGRRLREARPLPDGGRIRVGRVHLRFHLCDRRKETAPDD
jgi:DNA-binding winged helix-turn-helix (wHTH) protein